MPNTSTSIPITVASSEDPINYAGPLDSAPVIQSVVADSSAPVSTPPIPQSSPETNDTSVTASVPVTAPVTSVATTVPPAASPGPDTSTTSKSPVAAPLTSPSPAPFKDAATHASPTAVLISLMAASKAFSKNSQAKIKVGAIISSICGLLLIAIGSLGIRSNQIPATYKRTVGTVVESGTTKISANTPIRVLFTTVEGQVYVGITKYKGLAYQTQTPIHLAYNPTKPSNGLLVDDNTNVIFGYAGILLGVITVLGGVAAAVLRHKK